MPTSYEIYQTYRRGPAAVLRFFEEALGTRAIYGPPDPDTQQRTIDSLSEEIGRLKRQVSRLKAALEPVMNCERALLPISTAKARKCSPATVSGSRS